MDNLDIRICLTGGSSGGHLFPLIFVSREIKRIAESKGWNLKLFYLGSLPFKKEILKEEGIDVFLIPDVRLRKYFSFKNLAIFLNLPLNFLLAFYRLFVFMPDAIFSKGGPGTIGVILAGWLLRIPIIIHDSDSIPGSSNKIAGLFSKKIILSFESAIKYFNPKKTVVLGQPIDTLALKVPVLSEDYERFHLNEDEKIILVVGGSQGSKFLNELIAEALPEILNFSQVVHQTGDKNYQETVMLAKGFLTSKNLDNPSEVDYKFSKYHPYSFINHLDLMILMKMSDLVISRAGSGTIFELAALGKPSILIPIEEKVAGQHQLLNSRIYSLAEACYVLEEKNAKPHLLIEVIKEILFNEDLYLKMKKSAYSFSKVDSAFKIAQEIVKIIEK